MTITIDARRLHEAEWQQREPCSLRIEKHTDEFVHLEINGDVIIVNASELLRAVKAVMGE